MHNLPTRARITVINGATGIPNEVFVSNIWRISARTQIPEDKISGKTNQVVICVRIHEIYGNTFIFIWNTE